MIAMLRIYLATYTLPNGHTGQLTVIERGWYPVLELLWSLFGDLRSCSVRPA